MTTNETRWPDRGFTEHKLDDGSRFYEARLPRALVWSGTTFEEAWALHPETRPIITIHGKDVPIPRYQQAYGADYHFSGQTSRALPVPPLLRPLLEWARDAIDSRMNGLLLNWYDASLGHYIGAHHDSEKGMCDGAPIVTISFGEARTFRLSRSKGDGQRVRDFDAKDGTVFVLPRDTNRDWKHAVPKSARYRGRRISVTVRAFDTGADGSPPVRAEAALPRPEPGQPAGGEAAEVPCPGPADAAGQAANISLTLRHIIDNRKEFLDELNKRLTVVRDFTRAVAREYATGLYLQGVPGTGKTRTVRDVLDGEVKEIYAYKRGHVTPMGLFELIAEHPNEVIVLDDLANILNSDIALQILLSALEPPAGRSRPVDYKRQGATDRVWFRGGIICISNRELHDKELLGAFKSRVNVFNYNPSDAQLGALMLDAAGRGCQDVPPHECEEVAKHVISEMLRLGCRFDLRLYFDKALPLYRQCKDDEAETHWRDLVTAAVEECLVELRHEAESPASRAARRERETEIAREIEKAYADRTDRLIEWKRRTGKSERALYRRLADSR